LEFPIATKIKVGAYFFTCISILRIFNLKVKLQVKKSMLKIKKFRKCIGDSYFFVPIAAVDSFRLNLRLDNPLFSFLRSQKANPNITPNKIITMNTLMIEGMIIGGIVS